MKLHRFFASLIFLSVGMTGCFDIFYKNGSYTVEQSSDDAILAFKETVGEQIRLNNCATCHMATQIPFIASQNSSTAYHEVKSKVSFDSPEASRIVAKATDGHCTPQCRTSNASEWTDAISQWRDREASMGQGGEGGGENGGNNGGNNGGGTNDFLSVTYVMREVNIPDVLNPNPMPVVLDLVTDRVSGTGNFAGVRLQFEIDTIISLPNVYRVRNLRVNNTTAQSVAVSGIFARLNGAYDSNWGALYGNVNRVIPGGTTQSLSASIMLVPKVIGGPNRLQFGFVSVSSFICNQLAEFTNRVRPILKSTNPNKCLGCHGGGNGNATARFDMRSNVDADLCRIFMAKTSRSDPANSLAIVNPRFGANGHPNQSAVFTAQDAADFQTFIQQEWNTQP